MMARLIYGMNASLDGFVDHDRFGPDAGLFHPGAAGMGGRRVRAGAGRSGVIAPRRPLDSPGEQPSQQEDGGRQAHENVVAAWTAQAVRMLDDRALFLFPPRVDSRLGSGRFLGIVTVRMLELAVILFLLVFNGWFAMAEIALVSAKKARLQQRADSGHAGAALALRLMQNPERFLSTVQIGITLVGVLAGAFGGASLAGYLVPYLDDLGFTHVELMPVMQHPFGGSWGYHVTSYFAPDSRFGDPDGFRLLVDRLHQAGIGVILDWVPGHFATDEWALARFPRASEHVLSNAARGLVCGRALLAVAASPRLRLDVYVAANAHAMADGRTYLTTWAGPGGVSSLVDAFEALVRFVGGCFFLGVWL